jgi:putative heme-binding domain-containing protein
MFSSSSSVRLVLCGAIASLLAAAAAAQQDQPAPRTEAEILKSVKLPDGYEAKVFAKAPDLGYPVAVAAAADGTVFIAVDENGSIDRKENRGRVVRLRDTDGDGKSDESRVFAEMDSPRGLIWDGPSGTGPGTLYVMYPPKLTAFTDSDGDGKADKQEDILTGLGFDLKFRGADHTTNGCRMGIDGFIYIAVGDYGFTKAVAKDGTTLSMRGGGIVRIRPDGTGFEIVSHGQRNIYDVAVSPTLDLFTRDNTNDGGGWDVRLSHVPAGAHMGYPTLFKNFAEDMLQPLAELGGGSPCGALWLDEPGLQNGLYTVEWGRNAIIYHPLEKAGATYKQQQQEWLKMTRPTDMDVDGSGRLYITSWEGATFTYNGPNAGYVLRVAKKGKPQIQVPDFAKATAEELVQHIGSASSVIRLTAQQEFLRRVAANPAEHQGLRIDAIMALFEAKVAAGEMGPAYAAYWSFILAGRGHIKGFSTSAENWKTWSAPARLLIARAMGDTALDSKDVSISTAALRDSDAEIRAAGVTSLRRRSAAGSAQEILPLVADADPVVSHLAVRALSELKAAHACLGALDSSDEKVKAGALRALYWIYEPVVVDGLISRLPSAKGELRRGILNALCRLANQDEPYTDPKVWWGTRPDTSGPVYKPMRWAESDKIEAALKTALDGSSDDDARWLVQRMYLTKVSYPGLIELMLTKAGSDTPAKLTAIEGMFRPDNALPKEACEVLQKTAASEAEAPDIRARALRLLQRGSSNGTVFPFAVGAFATLAGHDIGQPVIAAAFEDFTRDGKNTKWNNDWAKMAQGSDAAKRTLAQTILVNAATSALVKGKEKQAAEAAVAKAWEKPETAASLLGVIARTGAKAYADQVKAHLNHANNAVAESALFASQKLGLTDSAAPAAMIGTMKYEDLFASVQKGGDAAKGKDIYLRAGCIACHTVDASEPPKGPIMSAAAKIYDRAALTESILKPNAKLAQGFESAWFKTKKGEQIEGFVTREGGDSLDVRNVAGQTVMIEKADIAERGHREQSMMPEGLMNAFSAAELSHLLAYLESLKGK